MVSEASPGGTRQRSRAVKQGPVPILFQQPENCGSAQQDVISVLVYALHSAVSEVVNWDHVNVAVPRSPVPLVYRGHRFDIAVQVHDRVLLIEVLSVDQRYWKRGEVDQHGESEKHVFSGNPEPAKRTQQNP